MQEEIREEDLLLEVQAALEDVFVAEIMKKDGALCMRFANGQAFRVSIEKII